LRNVPLTIDFELADPLATAADGDGLGLLLYDRDGHRKGQLGAAELADSHRLIEHRSQYFLGNRYFDLYASSTPAFEKQLDRAVSLPSPVAPRKASWKCCSASSRSTASIRHNGKSGRVRHSSAS
jgi:hypothetical protein